MPKDAILGTRFCRARIGRAYRFHDACRNLSSVHERESAKICAGLAGCILSWSLPAQPSSQNSSWLDLEEGIGMEPLACSGEGEMMEAETRRATRGPIAELDVL